MLGCLLSNGQGLKPILPATDSVSELQGNPEFQPWPSDMESSRFRADHPLRLLVNNSFPLGLQARPPRACAYVKYVVKWVYMSANICFVHARIAIFGACGHTSLFFWLWCDWACLYSLLYQSSLECLHRSLETIYVPVLSLPLGSENPEGSGIDLSLCPSFLAQSLARTHVLLHSSSQYICINHLLGSVYWWHNRIKTDTVTTLIELTVSWKGWILINN